MNITIKKTITTELGVRLDTGKLLVSGFSTPYATETREPEPEDLQLIASAVLEAMAPAHRAEWLAERGPAEDTRDVGSVTFRNPVHFSSADAPARQLDEARSKLSAAAKHLKCAFLEDVPRAAEEAVWQRDNAQRERIAAVTERYALEKKVLSVTAERDEARRGRDEAIARAEKAEAERERARMFKRERDEARTERNEAEAEIARWLPVVEAVGRARLDRALNLDKCSDPDGPPVSLYQTDLDVWRAYDAAVKAGES
jgi:hypothetical protein